MHSEEYHDVSLSVMEPSVHMTAVSDPIELVIGRATMTFRDHEPIIGDFDLTATWDGRGLQGTFRAYDAPDSDFCKAASDQALHAQTLEVSASSLGTAKFPLVPGTTFDVQQTLFCDYGITAAFRPASTELEFVTNHQTSDVTAHLLNVPPYGGAYLPPPQLCLSTGRWKIVISSTLSWKVATADPEELDEALRPFIELRRGGRYITHAAELSRVNGALFNRDQARAMLRRLETLLSFAFAHHAQPLYPHGYKQGSLSWAVLETAPILPAATAHAEALGWLPRSRTDHEALGAGLSRMLDALGADCPLQETVARAVDWYVAAVAATGRPESIVLAQASLEVLTTHYLTKHLHLSERGQANLDIADQLSVVLASLRIPSAIPDGWAVPKQKGSGTVTGPVLITRARNAAIHGRGERGVTSTEAPILALWYIEMILLRLLGYRGAFYDRITGADQHLQP